MAQIIVKNYSDLNKFVLVDVGNIDIQIPNITAKLQIDEIKKIINQAVSECRNLKRITFLTYIDIADRELGLYSANVMGKLSKQLQNRCRFGIGYSGTVLQQKVIFTFHGRSQFIEMRNETKFLVYKDLVPPKNIRLREKHMTLMHFQSDQNLCCANEITAAEYVNVFGIRIVEPKIVSKEQIEDLFQDIIKWSVRSRCLQYIYLIFNIEKSNRELFESFVETISSIESSINPAQILVEIIENKNSPTQFRNTWTQINTDKIYFHKNAKIIPNIEESSEYKSYPGGQKIFYIKDDKDHGDLGIMGDTSDLQQLEPLPIKHTTNSNQDFVTLVEINGENLDINKRGFNVLFENSTVSGLPATVYLVIGKDRNASSSLISKLLNYATKNAELLPVTDKDLSQVFMKNQDLNETSLRIVAWSQPVISKKDNGQTTAEFFLDIWGSHNMDMDDPNYTVLAGIGSALASSLVLIEQNDIKIETCNWLKSLMITGLKTGEVDKFQSLTILIQDWEMHGPYKPGSTGGNMLLKHRWEHHSMSDIASDVSKLFSEINCFLFPVIRDNSVTCRQHFEALLSEIIDESHSKLLKGTQTICEEIQNLVQFSEPLDVLLQLTDDSILKTIIENKKQQLQQEDRGKTINEDLADEQEDDDSPAVVDFQVDDDFFNQLFNPKVSINIGHASFSMVSPQSSACSLLPGIEKQLWNYDADNDIIMNEPTGESDAITIKEYLAKFNKKGSISAHNTLDLNSQEDLQALETNQPTQISTNQCPCDIIKDIFQESEYNPLNEMHRSIGSLSLRPALQTNTTVQQVDVQETSPEFTEILSDVGPSLERKSPHLITNESNLVSTQKTFQSSMNSFNSSDCILEEYQDSSFNPQNVFLTQCVTAFTNATLQSEISVDFLLNDVNQKTQSSLLKDNPNFIQARLVLTEAFEIILAYQNKMDQAFKEHVYFDPESQLVKLSNEIKGNLLNTIKNFTKEFYRPLANKLEEAERCFLTLNSEIKENEQISAVYTQRNVEEFYRKTLNASKCATLSGLQSLHKTTTQKCIQAFVYAYWGSNKSRDNHFLVKKLQNHLPKIYKDIESNWITEMKLARDLITKYVGTYIAEMNRTIQNPVITSEDQFNQSHNNAHSDAVRKLKMDMELRNLGIQEFASRTLEEELGKNKTSLKNKFIDRQNSNQSRGTETLKPNAPYNTRSTIKPTPSSPGPSSRNSEPIAVGIHLSLDTISVGTMRGNDFKCLFEPFNNYISLGDELLIGDACNFPNNTYISLREPFVSEKTDAKHKMSETPYHIEEIFTLALSKIHQRVVHALHTTNVAYCITIPTFCNGNLKSMLKASLTAADMNACLLKESDGLLIDFLHLKGKVQQGSKILVVTEDAKTDSHDLALYTLHPIPELNLIIGSNPCSGYFSKTKCGLLISLEKFPKTLEGLEVIMHCGAGTKDRNVKLMSNAIYNINKFHHKPDPLDILRGTCYLASYNYNSGFQLAWNNTNSAIIMNKLINSTRVSKFKNVFRVNHSARELSEENIRYLKSTAQQRLDLDLKKLQGYKSNAEKVCLEKISALEHDTTTNRSADEIKRLQGQVSTILKQVADEETTYAIREKIHIVNELS